MIGLSDAANLLAAGFEPILFESGEQAVARGQVRIFSPWYWDLAPAVTVLLRSVGVVSDGRRYEWVVALRAVETIDFMTARWAHLPYELLEKVSNRIINEL